MFENLTWEVIVAAIVTFFSSSAGAALLSYMIAAFKARKLNPDKIADSVVRNIEDTTIKVAVADSVKAVLEPISGLQNELLKRLEELEELVQAEATVNSYLAEYYSKSDSLSDARRVQFLQAKSIIDSILSGEHQKEAVVSEIAEVKLETKTENPTQKAVR